MVMVEYFGEFAKIQFSREVADRRNRGKLRKDYLNGIHLEGRRSRKYPGIAEDLVALTGFEPVFPP
jgi:hypothetical protein